MRNEYLIDHAQVLYQISNKAEDCFDFSDVVLTHSLNACCMKHLIQRSARGVVLSCSSRVGRGVWEEWLKIQL